jgi:hypothetical protein
VGIDSIVDRIALEGFAVVERVFDARELAMRPLLIHSSSKALDLASRRVLHIEYSASMVSRNASSLPWRDGRDPRPSETV